MRSGGVSTDLDSARYFNLHPLLMFLAFAFAMAEAVLTYRTAPLARDTQKLLHAALQAAAVSLAIASVVVLKRWKDHMSIGRSNTFQTLQTPSARSPLFSRLPRPDAAPNRTSNR